MTDTVRVPRAWLEAFRRDTNPTEPIADSGETVWDMFRHEASAMLAASPQGEGDCVCVQRGDGPEGCGLCNETGSVTEGVKP